MTATFTIAANPAVSAGLLRRPCSECPNFRRSSVRAVATAAELGPTVMESRRPSASLYEVLRVEQDASPTEIKSAYRSLAKLYHPDAAVRRRPEFNDDGGNFIEIRNAYETLSDPSARAMYDLSLTAARGGRRRRFPTPLSMNGISGLYPTRRWETDQCW